MAEFYWDTFNKFCDYLEKHNQNEVVLSLREAQRYVNGLTDGWYEYLEQMKEVKTNFKDQLDSDSIKQINYLIDSINKMLRKR